jgi:MFS family permease
MVGAGRATIGAPMSEPAAFPNPPRDPASPAPTWAALGLPVFRMLWLTWVTANICMWMNDVAAAWLMTSLTTSPALVALVQTASTLPVFLLGLPSGALADILDRRRWFMFTQVWVACVAVVAFTVLLSGGMNATLLLVLTFANGIGLALRWPVFAAIVPEIVPRSHLPAALAMNAIAMNVSRIVGPVLAGALIAAAGTEFVYALNAVASIGAALAIRTWKREARVSALPGERFFGAMRVGMTYVRESPGMHAVLLRVGMFFFHSGALLALLPLEAKRLQGGAGGFTLLLASMGAGAIATALMLPRLRADVSRNRIVWVGTVVQAAVMAGVAVVPKLWMAVPLMVVAGAAWIAVANTLTLAAQMSLPNWVRARGMSIYQMALMGGSALGAALWGQVAGFTSVTTALLAASASAVLLFAATRRFGVAEHADDLTQPDVLKPTPTPVVPDLDDGPVVVTVAYHVADEDLPAFRSVMQETRSARLRAGALSWSLYADTAEPGRWLEHFVYDTWADHLRHFERMTALDAALRQRRGALHARQETPQVTRWVAQRLDG